ncbi:hypothetical protein GQR58_021828 [Nymphon striatum]|nr:hypothetical protein GQR58_021828 [Nymphon striatum]
MCCPRLASFWSPEQCLAQQATSLLEAEGIRQMCPACTNVWVRDLGNYRYPVEKIGKCPTQYGKKDPRFKEVENGLLLELEDLKSKMKSIEEQLQNTSKSNDLVKDTESGNDEASSDVEVHSSNYLSENCDISQSKALEDLDNDEIEGSQDLFLSPTCPTPPVRTYNELHSNNSSKAVHITSSELACIFDEDF